MLVTNKAHDFTAPAVLPNGSMVDNFNLEQHVYGKKSVIIFFPLAFTFVCPSEIIACNNRLSLFKQRDTEVVLVSVDSKFTLEAWKNTAVDKGGIGAIDIPLISDLNKNISRSYDVLHDDSVSIRGTFILDKNMVVRQQTVNDFPIGRNIDEIIRVLDAIDFHEQHGDVCPAGWQKDQPAMQATADGVAKYLTHNADKL